MTGIGKSINTAALFLGIAAVSAGCTQTRTGQSMLGRTVSNNPIIVPEKYGLIEQHDIEVDLSHRQRRYVNRRDTLA